MPNKYIDKILRSRVYDVAIKTPLEHAQVLSEKFENNVFLKREDFQPVFSFKLRGAYNKIDLLSDSAKKKGIIASSAGNHAQGVAMSAQKHKIKATIVMPKTTPKIKVEAVKKLGAKVILFGDDYDSAHNHSLDIAKKEDLTFIHPYDDPDVIAGQGTIGMEILSQHPEPIDTIFVPVGGGGLIAGIAAYVKYVRPEIKVIGVEAEDSACLAAAMKAGKRTTLKEVGIFADGVAVKIIGKLPFKLCQEYVDEVITVKTDEICAAIKDVYDCTRSIVEPAGALSVAGIRKYVNKTKCKNKNLIGINSGANINFDRLRHIAERSEIGEQKEALFAVKLPEKSGTFKAFCQDLKERSITEFNYRYSSPENAQVFVGVRLNSLSEKSEITKELNKKAYKVIDLTNNEVAKLHLRYMIGGKATGIENERVFRFQFPERPKALLRFLNLIGGRWNISLFHYRNHGAAYGRVLVGIQVPIQDNQKFNKFIKDLGYVFHEETDNPGYQLFL